MNQGKQHSVTLGRVIEPDKTPGSNLGLVDTTALAGSTDYTDLHGPNQDSTLGQ